MRYYMREIKKRVRLISGYYVFDEYIEFFKSEKTDISKFNRGLRKHFRETTWLGVIMALENCPADTVYYGSDKALSKTLAEELRKKALRKQK